MMSYLTRSEWPGTSVADTVGMEGVALAMYAGVSCACSATMVQSMYRQSPSVTKMERAARYVRNGPGCYQARCRLTQSGYQTSLRFLSECLFFRLRRSLSQMSSARSAQPGSDDTTRARISFNIRRPLPFESAARLELCRHINIIANKCTSVKDVCKALPSLGKVAA